MISHEENAEMCSISGEEEIRKTIFKMNLDSAPGPDGFGGAFYQVYWEIIKGDVINFVQSFYNGKNLTQVLYEFLFGSTA